MLPVINATSSLSFKPENEKLVSLLSMLIGVHDVKDIYRQINNVKIVTIVMNENIIDT